MSDTYDRSERAGGGICKHRNIADYCNECEHAALKKENERLANDRGLLPIREVDQKLFAADVTCRQQAELIKMHEQRIKELQTRLAKLGENIKILSCEVSDDADKEFILHELDRLIRLTQEPRHE